MYYSEYIFTHGKHTINGRQLNFPSFYSPNRYRVVMMGDAGTGKTALVSQFMTSEYMHTYDASLGKLKGNLNSIEKKIIIKFYALIYLYVIFIVYSADLESCRKKQTAQFSLLLRMYCFLYDSSLHSFRPIQLCRTE